jgi:hypothetical protein
VIGMTIRSLPTLAATAIAVTTTAVLTNATQVRRQPPERASVPIEVALKIAGEAYSVKGQGSCTHAPQASIYDIRSQMWTVRHEEGERSFQLTLWKPADGSPSMFNIASSGKRNLTISTVRGGQVSGSGTVTLAPSAKGGTFTIDAKTKGGEAVTGTFKCDAFTPAIAEGGH